MATSEKKSFSPITLIIDLALTAAFFVFIFGIVKTHVQSRDPQMINLWGGLTAGCMAGVFWLAMQMLKTVYRFQRLPQVTAPSPRAAGRWIFSVRVTRGQQSFRDQTLP